ncbi:MAG: hypothetical protein R2864_09430 [Syntrophotaleaceae bacterium]
MSDQPLDLQSKEVLLASLRSFPGTLVFVSHDRYFVDALATRVLRWRGACFFLPGELRGFFAGQGGDRRRQPLGSAG